MESSPLSPVSLSSVDNIAKLNKNIGVVFFKDIVKINYCFDSIEQFHNQLINTVVIYNLSYNDVVELIENYHVIYKTMKTWMASNVNVFETCNNDNEQITLLSQIFPGKSGGGVQVKEEWMFNIANLIYYSHIVNNDSYNGEGYIIDRESSFTIHHLVSDRYTALKEFCPFCKETIALNSRTKVTCDHCPQQYCNETHKQDDKWPPNSNKPRNIKKNHCCDLKNKQFHYINMIVKNNLSYTEDFPIPTRLPVDNDSNF
jgi:hypothetical protein